MSMSSAKFDYVNCELAAVVLVAPEITVFYAVDVVYVDFIGLETVDTKL